MTKNHCEPLPSFFKANASVVGGKHSADLLSAGEMPALHVTEVIPELLIVVNNFYGDSITVTGLLTGQDIFAALKERNLGADREAEQARRAGGAVEE